MGNDKIYEIRAIEENDFEYIKESIEDYRKYNNDILIQLDGVSNKGVKLLCYFSLIESIAQDLSNYPEREQQKTFVEFVLKYQNKYLYHEFVYPITLFYHLENEIQDKINLLDLMDGQVYNPLDRSIRDKVDEIREVLEKNMAKEKVEKYLIKHRYVDLLYRMRCRISHEFSYSHISINTREEEPYYINFDRTYKIENAVLNDKVWQLSVPIQFIKNICENCINNYLDECLRNKKIPCENDSLGRFCELSWYSR